MTTFNCLGDATYSTTRPPAFDINEERGDPVTHLENVEFVSIMPVDNSKNPLGIRDPIQAMSVELYEAFTEKQSHTDDGVIVDQVPDIQDGDYVIIGSVSFTIRRINRWPATSATKAFLRLILEQSK
jgi:hypothetical protein